MTLKRRNLRWEEVDKSNIPLDKLIIHYESFNRTEGKSPRTISWYSDTLHTLEGFLEKRGSSLLLDAGINEAREFILYLQEKEKWGRNGRTCSKGSKLPLFTVQGFVRSLKAFYSWLRREGYTEMKDLRLIATGKTVKIAGSVIRYQTPPTRNGNRVVYVIIEGGTGIADVTVFDNVQKKCGQVLFREGWLVVKGKIQRRGARALSIMADDLAPLRESVMTFENR